MSDEIQVGGPTVEDAKAKKFLELVEAGETPKEAAAEVGATVNSLRRSGVLGRAIKDLLARVEQEKMLDKKSREMLAHARAVELMMQDEDLKVALGAVKAELGTGGTQVAVQINNNLRADPNVLESLKTLQLEVDADEQKD